MIDRWRFETFRVRAGTRWRSVLLPLKFTRRGLERGMPRVVARSLVLVSRRVAANVLDGWRAVCLVPFTVAELCVNRWVPRYTRRGARLARERAEARRTEQETEVCRD